MQSFKRHCDDEELEAYSRGAVSAEQAEAIEEHLLGCAACVERIENLEALGRKIRSAAAVLAASPDRGRISMSRIAWPAAACVALAAGGWWLRSTRVAPVPAVAISLEAVRGGDSPQASAGTPLDLRPDLSGLPAFDSYLIQIVDSAGSNRWEGALAASAGVVRVPARSPGLWFVRVYSPSRDLLREYALRVGEPPAQTPKH